MKTLKLVLMIGCFAFYHSTKAQLMINGGFEILGGTPDDDPAYGASIENAINWNNLNGSCDLIHSNYASFWAAQSPVYATAPRNGIGCMRFGSNPGNPVADEYCYGKTLALTAGEEYTVSFWIRWDYPPNFPLRQIGACITPVLPNEDNYQTNPYVETFVPQIRYYPGLLEYQKVSFCFTATQSVNHYVIIGFFNQNPDETYNLYWVDDVDVSPVDVNDQSTPIISPTNTIFCDTDPILLDGSTSLNAEEHEWDIYEVNGATESLVYNGLRYQTPPTTFAAGTALGLNIQKGKCYRAYLTTYRGCSNKTYFEFCIENPIINFINGNEAVCGNAPLNLEVTGGNGWTYSWSSGQTGVGLKNVTVTPAPPTAIYSVTATTPLGCTVTKNISLTVHDPNNVAPWMDGINGTGEYTIYVNQGDEVNFTSTLYNDHSNEEVVNNIIPPSIPTIFFNSSFPTNNTGVFNFSLNAGFGMLPDLPMGSYPFTVTTTDKNACENKGAEFVFTVNVICEVCDICVEFENRTPTTYPLPLETKAAKCIFAGFNEEVVVGDVNVLFQAGEYIELGPFFESGSNFEATIDQSTCLSNCDDCCEDFTGFTIDLPLTDLIVTSSSGFIWEAFDTDNPYCAYNARAYKLMIEGENSGDLVYEKYEENQGCCGFFSKASNNPISHSTIFWDGYGNRDEWDGVFYNDGDDGAFKVNLILYGCGGSEELYQTWVSVITGGNKSISGVKSSTLNSENHLERNQEITIFPNPTYDFIRIDRLNNEDYEFEILNSLGQNMEGNYNFEENMINIKQFSPGHYHIKIKSSNQIITKEFIVL